MKLKHIVMLGICSSLLVACGEDYVAKVNGKGIETKAFEGYLAHKRMEGRSEEEKQKALDKFLRREALANLVEQKLMQDDPVIQAEIREQKKEILINRYFDRYLKEQVTEQSITNFYNANIDKYQEKKIHVAHILLRLNRNMDESQRKVKRTTAQEAYSKIQAGLDFAEAASQYSEDQVSAKKGGDLGWLAQGAIHKVFSDEAFALKKGETSQVIETPFGFHIIKALDNMKTSSKSLNSVKGEIRYQLREEAKKAERARLLDQVKIEKG